MRKGDLEQLVFLADSMDSWSDTARMLRRVIQHIENQQRKLYREYIMGHQPSGGGMIPSEPPRGGSSVKKPSNK